MRLFIKSILALVTLFSFLNCSSKKETNTKKASDIESVYFQKWLGGQELSGTGTNFHLKFKKPLDQDVYLAKVYFQNHEAFFDKENETTFIARFYTKSPNQDLIMDGDSTKEFGNTVPDDKRVNPDFPFNLKPTEAILEFHNKNKIEQLKIVNIKEKELIAYP